MPSSRIFPCLPLLPEVRGQAEAFLEGEVSPEAVLAEAEAEAGRSFLELIDGRIYMPVFLQPVILLRGGLSRLTRFDCPDHDIL